MVGAARRPLHPRIFRRRGPPIDFYALQHGYAIFIMDCTSAFYHADEPEEVYVKPPPEWIAKQIESDQPNDVMWRLKKQLSGKRTAGQRLGGPRRRLTCRRARHDQMRRVPDLLPVVERCGHRVAHGRPPRRKDRWRRVKKSSGSYSSTSSSRRHRCWSPR